MPIHHRASQRRVFRPEPGDPANCTPALRRALARCADERGAELFFPEGTYHFRAEGAVRRHCSIANHDSGPKDIVFHLRDFADFSITGENARFIFHGRVNPFVAENCGRLELSGFSVDWDRSFITRAEVLSTGSESMDLRLPADEPYFIEDGRWVFFDDEYKSLRPYLNFMEYDVARRAPLADTTDCYVTNRAEELEAGIVRVRGVGARPRPGSTIVIKHELRLHPGIVLDRCRETSIHDVTLHHSCGMGVIAQNCGDVTLARVEVTPAPDGDRLISTSDDAAHFVNCRGRILIEDCLFENQWDDAVNIHGIYRRLRRRGVGTPFYFLEAGHYQQFGVEMAAPGETLELVDRDTLLTYGELKVKAVMPLTPQITRVEFETPLPEDFRDGDVVANLAATPSATIRRCVMRRNKPRGVLVTTPKPVRIEDNHFHTAGAAIYLGGDANFWFESGAVRDVLIRGNTFDHCRFMPSATGRAVIDIAPEIAPEHRPAGSYHRNIRIEGNRFIGTPNAGDQVAAFSAADLQVTDNDVLDES